MKTTIFSILLLAQLSFAGLFSTSPKEVCNSIGDVSVRLECDKHIAGKTFEEKYLDRCLVVSKIVKKVSAGNKWESVLDCLDGMAGKTKNSIAKAQLEACEKLENSNKASYVTTCLVTNFDNGLFEICTKPLKAGISNYEAAGTCMDSIKTYQPSSSEAVVARQNCFEKNTKGPMRVNTWSEVSSCLREAAPEPAESAQPTGKPAMKSYR